MIFVQGLGCDVELVMWSLLYNVVMVVLASVLIILIVFAQKPTPSYYNIIPISIMPQDKAGYDWYAGVL